MNHPRDIPALAPAYEREILYRVLQGPMGWMLRDIAVSDTALARVNLAVQHIRREYAKPLRVDDLASSAAMSVSAAGYSVTAAAHEVGYQSSTQFSREYAREFGLPPGRDATRIRIA